MTALVDVVGEGPGQSFHVTDDQIGGDIEEDSNVWCILTTVVESHRLSDYEGQASCMLGLVLIAKLNDLDTKPAVGGEKVRLLEWLQVRREQ